jgi:hypothetical protein
MYTEQVTPPEIARQPGKHAGPTLYAAMGALCLVAFLAPALPLYVIRPFRAQDPTALAVALSVRRWGPWIAPVAALASLPLALAAWRASRRWTGRAAAAATFALTLLFAVLAQINVYESLMFHAVDGLRFVAAAESKVLADDMVLSVNIGGETKAYPIRTIGYHHIVNDRVGGVDVAITYCTLCHTGLVWRRTVNGRTLTFHLGGINNQNALLRDAETGSFWQQSTGIALSGPLKGTQLELVPADELSFAEFRKETPNAVVMAAVPKDEADYETADWDQRVRRYPTVVDTRATGIEPRELMLGVVVDGASRAYPLKTVLEKKLIVDTVARAPIALAVATDGKSVRCFRAEPGQRLERDPQTGALLDAASKREWSFEGCAASGRPCLTRVAVYKDFWFNWRVDHPRTTVYGR